MKLYRRSVQRILGKQNRAKKQGGGETLHIHHVLRVCVCAHKEKITPYYITHFKTYKNK